MPTKYDLRRGASAPPGGFNRALTPAEYRDHILRPLAPVVVGMERAGVPLDRDVAADIRLRAETDAMVTLSQLDDAAYSRGCPPGSTNWNYWEWLAEFLHGDQPWSLGIPPSPYWKKGRVDLVGGEIKTDDRALEYLQAMYPEHRDLLFRIRQYRRQSRVANYTDSWIELAVPHPSGIWCIHPTFGLAFDADDRPGARTGRFGVKNPPLQQVPARKDKDPYRVRRCMVAPPGRRLIVADYSQLEVVILAHVCTRLFGSRGLSDKVRRGAPDMHSTTAKYVFGEVLGVEALKSIAVADIKKQAGWYRDMVKAIRYGLLYGKGDYGFGWTLFMEDGVTPLGEKRAHEMRMALLDLDPEIVAYQAYILEFIRRHRAIVSLLGRWFPLPDADPRAKEWAQHRAERQADNYPEQAGAAEVVIVAMIAAALCDVLRRLGFVLIMQVHDELIGHVPEDKADEACRVLKLHMEETIVLEADLQAEPHHGPNWEEAKK